MGEMINFAFFYEIFHKKIRNITYLLYFCVC
jgi:hypothetical protein